MDTTTNSTDYLGHVLCRCVTFRDRKHRRKSRETCWTDAQEMRPLHEQNKGPRI